MAVIINNVSFQMVATYLIGFTTQTVVKAWDVEIENLKSDGTNTYIVLNLNVFTIL